MRVTRDINFGQLNEPACIAQSESRKDSVTPTSSYAKKPRNRRHIYIQFNQEEYEKPIFQIGDLANDGEITGLFTNHLCQPGGYGPVYRSKEISYRVSIRNRNACYFPAAKHLTMKRKTRRWRKLNVGVPVRVYFPNGVILHTMITGVMKNGNERAYYHILITDDISQMLRKEILSSPHHPKWDTVFESKYVSKLPCEVIRRDL